MRAGLIGLGAMGLPMARNVMKAGHSLGVWARRPEAAAIICDEGAQLHESVAALARASDVVVLVVTNSPDVEALVTGDDGVLAGAHNDLVIVDMSTIAPAVSRDMATRSAACGVAFLDAPVSGGTQGALAGTLSIMVGGDAEALERVRPILSAMGSKIFHVGPSGSGEIVKLVNNTLVGAIAAATAEALVMGVAAGVDVDIMAQVVGASTGASWQLSNQFPLRAFSGTFQPGFMTDLLLKDLGLALDLAEENHAPMFLAAIARQLFGQAHAAGYGRDDYTSVLRVLESVAGVEVRG